MTIVAIPTEGAGGPDAPVGEHFGRVPTYTLFDVERGVADVVENTSEHMGGTGYPAQLLSDADIDVLLCRGLGRRAIQMLTENGVDVCIGVSGTAQQAFDAWKSGQLKTAADDDACTRHVFHDHD